MSMERRGYYLIERLSSGEWRSDGIWYFDGTTAMAVDVFASGSKFTVGQNDSLQSALKRNIETDLEVRISSTEFLPGQYYHQMARPVFDGHHETNMLPNRGQLTDIILNNHGQFRVLIDLLERIFLIAYPSPDNLSTYGYEIRNLLILSCTECETQWRSILRANGYRSGNYTTRDYVRLEAPMRLHEYSVAFKRYPWLASITPFGNWNAQGRPTQDLSWYHAYNATKHDRQGSSQMATLGNAMMAVAACWVMLIAQFGGPTIGDQEIFRDYFSLSNRPDWTFPEKYLFVGNDTYFRNYEAINCPF